MENKNRIAYVDFMKAFGMLTIIWGHIMETGITNAFVYAFHIPLFFFLSGLMFKKERYPSFPKFFKKRVKSLLIPYVIFSFLTWLMWLCYTYFTHAKTDSYIMPLLQTFIAQGSGGFLVHNVPLWFVTCLFVVEILYFFIAKLSGPLKIIMCILCGVVGSLMTLDNPYFNFKLLPWNIEVALAAIPFYAIGNYLIEYHSHEEMVNNIMTHKVLSSLIFVLCIGALYLGASFNGHVSMGSDHLNNFFIFYPTALCGIVMMSILCVWLSSLKHNFLWKFISWFGQNSYTTMSIHNPIKGIVVVLVATLVGGGTTSLVSDNYLLSGIAFIISLIAICIGILIVNVIKRQFHKHK